MPTIRKGFFFNGFLLIKIVLKKLDGEGSNCQGLENNTLADGKFCCLSENLSFNAQKH